MFEFSCLCFIVVDCLFFLVLVFVLSELLVRSLSFFFFVCKIHEKRWEKEMQPTKEGIE